MSFQTTLWSVVSLAKESGEGGADAFGMLCETYWKPLYIYARRKGLRDEDARDAVQDFYLLVFEKKYLAPADKNKGKFRTFLLTCFQRYLANQYKRENAQKRGGHMERVYIDWQVDGIPQEFYSSREHAADQQFERDWAYALINRAMDRLTEREKKAGRGELLMRLGNEIFMSTEGPNYTEMAKEFSTTKNALKVAVHRLRIRFREAIVEEVRKTVSSDDEVEEEVRHLLRVLSRES